MSITFCAPAASQGVDIDNSENGQDDGPKVGLVLSGGGVKGLAHVALLQILEEVNMPIDYIAGTSMGSIIGGLYAIGYSASDIEKIVLSEDWTRLLSDEVRRRYIPIEEKMWDSTYMLTLPIVKRNIVLPGGLISGQELMKLLTRLTVPVHGIDDFNQFPIPFVAIATDFETGTPIVMRNGYLPDVFRASMSIPTIFTPVLIENRMAIDGGVSRNFPVTDVLEMGADFVIGVNVSTGNSPRDSLNSIFSILNKTVFYHIVQSTHDQSKLVDHLIEPNIDSFSMFNFDDIPQIIALGKSEAEKHRTALQQIADSLNALRKPRERYRYLPPKIEEIYVADVVIHDLKDTDEHVIRSELRIEPGTWVSPEFIEFAIDRVYSLQFFETVTYRLIPIGNGAELHVFVKEKLGDQFRVGLRYDNRTKSSLLFNATFRNAYKPTSTLRFNVRLGEEPMYDTQFFYYVGFRPKLGVLIRGNFTDYLSDIYREAGPILASVKTESVKGEIWVGPVVSSVLIMGVGFRDEAYRISRIIGSDASSRDWRNNHNLFAFIWLDTQNDGTFPTNGQMVRADYSQSITGFGNPVIFSQYSIHWDNFIPINPRVTGIASFYSAITTGDIPIHHRKTLGGYPDFPGYYNDEISNEWIKSMQLGIQIEMWRNRYLTATGVAGQASELHDVDTARFPMMYGWSLAAAAKTVIGPVKVVLHGSERHALLYDIRIGFNF